MLFDTSVADMARGWAAVQPEAMAVSTVDGDAAAFGDLDRRSSQFARALMAADVHPGDRVAFLGRDAAVWAVILAGSSKARAAAVPLNWRLARAELRQIVDDAAPSVIVSEPAQLPLLGLDPAPHIGPVVVSGDDVVALADWVKACPDDDPDLANEPDDIAFVFYTSGTTGRPKGVQLANRNVAANLAQDTPFNSIGPGDTVFVPAPTFHVSGSGWLFFCLAHGAHAVYMLDLAPAGVLRTFADYNVTHALTVPALMQVLARHPIAKDVDLSHLRMLIYGGSPISPTALAEVRGTFGCDLAQGYGMTETTGPITFLWPADHRGDVSPQRLASAGRPVSGVEVRVVDPATGDDRETGTVGEVWTRSGQNMAGYLNRPDEQAETVTADGWLRTGDAGYFDADGYLFLTDRIKDMIVSGGENVYPVEVENVVMSHPGVEEVAVVGVPDERWGETVKAVVVRRGGASVTAEELIAYCRDRLAHYKCPTSIDIVDTLPRNPSGKILRREVREPYWAGSDRRIS